ncbi:hypothetical protein SO694_00002559 [Aureococcus anophagefferens]|uniref:Uncharacterized protein n=1 Tax=Aureococcus anophagefferens TaxID=44056 RepID=A0ABR1GCA0_AURAN
MVVTGQATWKKRVGAMILPTWGRRVSASLVLLSDACGSDATSARGSAAAAAGSSAAGPARGARACPDGASSARGEFSEAFPQSDKLLPHCLAEDGVEFRASPNFLPLPPSFYVAYDDVRNNAVGSRAAKESEIPNFKGFISRPISTRFG